MLTLKSLAWFLTLVGMALWVAAYLIQGHQPFIAWSSFLPAWLADCVPNRESEVAAIVTFVGNGLVMWEQHRAAELSPADTQLG